MKVDLTKKEIAALGELIYAVTEDRALLSYPADPFGPVGDARPTNKGTRFLRSAWNKFVEVSDMSILEWDDVFAAAPECEKCGK